MSILKRWFKSIQTKASLAILITAAILIETTLLVQYFYAARGIREGVTHRAKAELSLTSLRVRNVAIAVEVASANMAWVIERELDTPDSIYSSIRRLVEYNPTIVGCGVSFIPDYYPDKGHWFEPYVAMRDDGTIDELQIGSASHDYLKATWFKTGLQANPGAWTEPYFDEAGARMMLCTYVVPVHDRQGRVVAVLGADVSLDWLSTTINAHPIYPSSYNLMVSREGKMLACPMDKAVMRSYIAAAISEMGDSTISRIGERMLAGESGVANVKDGRGNHKFVFYAPIEGDAGWSMAVVCASEEIFHSLRTVSLTLSLLMLVGLALLAYIVFRTIRGFNHLQVVSAEKERMGSELRIANAIQMGMLPKTFPPFPDRNDVELSGSLVPAKEVGGDLYDFFIRDEKLFFCVGDVSGKGVPASLVMAVTRSLFRSVSVREANPGRIVESMNTSMSEMNDSNMFVTLFVGVLDLPTGRLHYCNAGHCAPLLIGSGVGSLPVDSNIPIGLMGDWNFVSQEAIVSPKTIIFLYTDGLTEAENAQHEQFGEVRMLKVARQEHYDNPAALIEQMTEAVGQFVSGAVQSDDLTMLALRYAKPQKEERLSRSITLPSDLQAIPRLTAFVEKVCEAVGFDAPQTMNLNLAVEEAVANVMNYAYPPGVQGNVNIEACANDSRLKFTIIDSGRPFDPTAVAEPDTSLSADQRPIGGLGIHLIRQLVDSVNYEFTDGHNVLTLRKHL